MRPRYYLKYLHDKIKCLQIIKIIFFANPKICILGLLLPGCAEKIRKSSNIKNKNLVLRAKLCAPHSIIKRKDCII